MSHNIKALNLGNPEKMLLALLRASLHHQDVETDYFQQATEEDWLKCFRLAVRQGVSSLAWGGIERLPAKHNPPLDVKLSWALLEKKQLEKYKKHCLVANEVTQLFAKHGIATIILKGVGLSRFYPVPAHREGSDIDIYTYSVDKTKMTNEEAYLLANELLLKQGAILRDSSSIKHSTFRFNGITFENHSMFLHEAECKTIAKSEQWLHKHIKTQVVKLLDGECQIEVPSVTFDSVFVPLHAAQHYGMGLSLKHLCDWTLLLKQNGMNLPDELNDKYFKQITTTLTQLCNQYLGLIANNQPPIANRQQPIANKMMQEILYPPYYRKDPTGGFIRIYWFQLRNRIHIFKLKHRLLGVSFWGKIWGLLSRMIKSHNSL